MGKMQKIVDFMRTDVWRSDEQELTKSRRVGYITLRSILLCGRGFASHRLNVRANALTYSLMFAAVPIIALMLAIARGFGMEQAIEDILNNSFLAQTNIVPTIMGFVRNYLETAQGGVFIGVGLLILLWSVWAFFSNVEIAFNDIWRVKKNRNPMRQIITYMAILVFVPIVIIVTSGLSLYLTNATADIVFFQDMAPVTEWLLVKLMPFVLCWLIFTWMYWAVPNTKVRFLPALIPGVLIGTLFQVLQTLTMWLFMMFARTSVVYGAFAAIPLLLIWFQIACLMILVGAELSFSIQNNEQFNYEKDIHSMTRRYKDYLTLYITYLIVKRFEQEQSAPTAEEISVENKIPMSLVCQLLELLVELKVITATMDEATGVVTYRPALYINKITVGKMMQKIDMQGSEEFLQNPTPEREAFWQRYLALRTEKVDLDTILVKDLLD